MTHSHRRRCQAPARRRSASALACERLESRAVLAVIWPATAPVMEFGDANQIYVNQFGDARIDAFVIGPAGQRLNGTIFWDDVGTATIRTTGALETEMAWYGPTGRLTSEGFGSAEITRDIEAGELHVLSIAGRDDLAVGSTGIAIDGPDYQEMKTINVVDGFGHHDGTISGACDYAFLQFTVPADGVWTVGVEDLGCDPTMVLFDATGTPIGGSFVTAMTGDPNADSTVTWSGRLSRGETCFVRIDGAMAATGTFNVFVEDHADQHWVTTNADAGPGSLRDAITLANLSSNPSTIWFDPAVNGLTLGLLAPLPAITWDTTLAFEPGTTEFTIDAAAIPKGSGPILSVSGWDSGGARTFARFDTAAAPLRITNFADVGVSLPDDLFNSRVTGLSLVGRGESKSVGIAVGSPGGTRFPGTSLSGNSIAGVEYGIVLAFASELAVYDNAIQACGQTGLVAVGPCFNTAIFANSMSGNGTGLAGYGAMGLSIGDEEIGNSFVDNVKSGIYLTGDSRRTGVFCNTFLRNNVGVTLDHAQGALVGGTPVTQHNTITADGSTALFQYRAGIYGVGDLAGSIVLNTTINTPFLGVNLAHAQGLTVADTTVRNHGGLGLVAQGEGVGMMGTTISGLTVERIGPVPPVDTAGVVLIDATGMRLDSGNFSGDTTALFVFNDAAGLAIVDNVFAGRTTGVGLFQARHLVFGHSGLGNTIQNASGAGIYTGGDLTGTSIVANIITGNAVGIVLDNTTNLAVGGAIDGLANTVVGTGNSTGVWGRLRCNGTKVTNTRFSNHAANTSLGATTGIDLQPWVGVASFMLDRKAPTRGVLVGNWSNGAAVTYYGDVEADDRVRVIDSAEVRDPSGQKTTLHFGADGQLQAIEGANGDVVRLEWESPTLVTARIRLGDEPDEIVVTVRLSMPSRVAVASQHDPVSRAGIGAAFASFGSAVSSGCEDVADAIGLVCTATVGPEVRLAIAVAACVEAPMACQRVMAALEAVEWLCSTVGYSPVEGAPAPVDRICQWIEDRLVTPPPPPPEPGQSFLSISPAEVAATVGIGLTDGEQTFTVTNTSEDVVTLTATSSSTMVEVSAPGRIDPGGSVTVAVKAPWNRFRSAGSESATVTVRGLRQNPVGNTDDLSRTVSVPVRLTVLAPRLEVSPPAFDETRQKGPEALFTVTVTNSQPKTQLSFQYVDDGSVAMFVPGSARTLTLNGGESTTIQIRVPTDDPSWLDGETRRFAPRVRIDRPDLTDRQEKTIDLGVTLGDVDLRGTYVSGYTATVQKTTRGDQFTIEDITCRGVIRIVISDCVKVVSPSGTASWKLAGSVTVTGVDGTEGGRTIESLPFADVDFFPQDPKFLPFRVNRPAEPPFEEWVATDFVFEKDGMAWGMRGGFDFYKMLQSTPNTTVEVLSRSGPGTSNLTLRR